MDLNQYFEGKEGIGILSTADAEGNVDSAIYAIPHVIDAETVAFIMRPRRSYGNLGQNPKAAYLFVEKGPGYQGKRLYLQKTQEEKSQEKINLLRRSQHGCNDDAEATLVYFKVTNIRPLVGDKETSHATS